ncbi:MAG: monothiol glutaredoxin, Grx4 family [Pelagibacterales bacterium]|jgi:monothiol glutaredoxin|nr:monothiol glutaredoxin, Grx4 family [Pelagibacterales bacterium]|tara:strand:- start:1616 stop:1939 length:324 start_codon:yes stop_codon:yes gene_type:complete
MSDLDEGVKSRIEKEINSNDVVLFMKGTPVFPQCGFSSMVSQVLNHIGVEFKGVDVLAEATLRNGIKAFSDWPTIPQLYYKGEFVGGCDIVKEMYESGELQELFDKK